MRTVLIVGEFDSDNVGDQLIGEGHEILFSSLGWHVVIASLEPSRTITGEPPALSKVKGLKQLHRRLYRRFAWYRHSVEAAFFVKERRRYMRHARDSLMGIDFLIIGGGQLFSDGTLRMLKRLLVLSTVARRNGIAVSAFGTGVSRPTTAISRILIARILRNLSSRSWLRDAGSVAIAQKYAPIGILAAQPVPDCAIARGVQFGDTAKSTLAMDVVGIAPMSARSLKMTSKQTAASDAWWIRVISLLIERGYRPVLFCSGVSDDQRRCAQIKALADKIGIRVDLAKRPECAKEFIDLLSKMSRVLSQRLHISISFYSIGSNPKAVSWDLKVDQFFHAIGMGDCVINPWVTPDVAVEVLLSDRKPLIDPNRMVKLSRQKAVECLECVDVRENYLRG